MDQTFETELRRLSIVMKHLLGISLIASLSSVGAIAQTAPPKPNSIQLHIDEYVTTFPPPRPISADDPMQSPQAQFLAVRRVNETLSRFQTHPQNGSSDALAPLAKIMLQVTGARKVIQKAWITSAKLISYRSSLGAQIFPNGPMPYVARTCVLENSSHSTISDNHAEFDLVYGNCTLDLNNMQDFSRQPKILEMEQLAQGRPASFEIMGVGVKLTNDLSRPLVDFDKMECSGCILDIKAATTHPSAEQQRFVRTLLEDDPKFFLLYGRADGVGGPQSARQVPNQPK